ncbi:CopD family protein [Kaistella palustris]|uniref:CopD family protein n=1 Tax=Kaistella palustris TaxID=493376 RepID=UPI0004067CBE|nr:CopD family protein [Kaistella palustris]
MLYSVVKAVHLIFMVSYFAGIFYLVRLFVYYKDTDEFDDTKKHILREQYVFMARRLWNIITVPAGIIMLTSGLVMIFLNFGLMRTPWFHLKLTFLVGLLAYHIWCWKKVLQIRDLQGDTIPTANLKLRQANEIATFILFLIIFTVILKYMVIDYWWQLIVGFFVLVFLIMATVKLVNKKKSQKSPE